MNVIKQIAGFLVIVLIFFLIFTWANFSIFQSLALALLTIFIFYKLMTLEQKIRRAVKLLPYKVELIIGLTPEIWTVG